MGTAASSLSQQSAVETIYQWSLKPQHELIFDSGRREISQYLQAVAKIQQSPYNKTKGVVSDENITKAMARLRLEFLSVLRRQADHHQAGAPPSTTEFSSMIDSTYVPRCEDYVPPDLPGKNVVEYLRSIADRMSSSGQLGECMSVYKSVRKPFLEAELRRLYFDEFSGLGESLIRRLLWDELKVKIELWAQVSRICVNILFAREKLLCDQVFDGLGGDSSARDVCFLGTVRDSADRLFNFARALSSSNLPHVRMEAVLGLYDAFFAVQPNVRPLFSCEPGRGILNVCSETLARIESDVGRMLYDFESAVLRESPIVGDDDRGEVCQSARYVMDQVNVIVRHKRMLTSLIKSSPSLEFGDVIFSREGFDDHFANRSSLEIHLILIIAALQMNLENKSKMYRDPSLGLVFAMNNVRYVVQRIEESGELRQMIGNSYLNKLNENVQVAVDSYQASICGKLLKCFENKGLYVSRCFKSRLSKTALKERLRSFNAKFEEVQNLYSVWALPDLQLRDLIRASISQKLVPAYRDFLEKFNENQETMLLKEKHIQHSAEDLEHLVLNTLFAQTEVVV